MNIDDLEMTIRSNNALKAHGIMTVEQLVAMDYKTMASIRNLGAKSANEIVWACLQLLNGRLTAERIEWEKRWPERPDNVNELRAKAKKFDAIKKIIDA